jgi:hypothetical protein
MEPDMRNFALPMIAIGAMLCSGLIVTPAEAQATRTWVSGVGDDVNPCSRTAPCKTFAGAISKTAAGGIINCIDPGGFGTLTIIKSIEIDCLNTKAGMLAANTNGVNVNGAGITAVLRGLSIEGAGTGFVGVNIVNAATVHIEKSTIRGFRAGNASGVRIATTAGQVEVNISDSYITDNGAPAAGGGVISVPSGGAFAFVQFRNVHVNNNTFGVANTSNSRMRISHAVFSGNTTGVEGDPGSVVTLNDTDIVFNNTGISGATTSFGNNRISGNTSDGTAPSAAGPQSTDLGQK